MHADDAWSILRCAQNYLAGDRRGGVGRRVKADRARKYFGNHRGVAAGQAVLALAVRCAAGLTGVADTVVIQVEAHLGILKITANDGAAGDSRSAATAGAQHGSGSGSNGDERRVTEMVGFHGNVLGLETEPTNFIEVM